MYIGAMEAGGTKFVLGIGDEHGNILDRISIPTTTPKETMTKVIDYFKDKSMDAIGLSCFGPIDNQKDSLTYGSITTTPKSLWQNYNIVKEIEKYYNVPVGFDTDVNGAALGGCREFKINSIYNCGHRNWSRYCYRKKNRFWTFSSRSRSCYGQKT